MDTLIAIARAGTGLLYALSALVGFGLMLLTLRRPDPRSWVLAPLLLVFGCCGRLPMYFSMLAFTCWLSLEILAIEESFPGLRRLTALALPTLCLALLLAAGSGFASEGRALLRVLAMGAAWACLILGMTRVRRALGEGVARLGFDFPVLVRSTFSAVTLGIADGVVGGNGVLTLLLAPILVLLHLARGSTALGRGEHRLAFQRMAAAVVWLGTGVGIVGWMAYGAHLANTRDQKVFTRPGRSQRAGLGLSTGAPTNRTWWATWSDQPMQGKRPSRHLTSEARGKPLAGRRQVPTFMWVDLAWNVVRNPSNVKALEGDAHRTATPRPRILALEVL